MKKIIFVIMMVFVVCNLKSQELNDIYLIGSAIDSDGNSRGIKNGFYKLTLEKSQDDRSNSISFIFGSIQKDYEMFFDHFNSLKSTYIPQIVELPISQLDGFDVIEIDSFMATKTREEVWQWMLQNDEKKVWVIDRNSFYKSSPALQSPDRMKLVETDIWIDNIPDSVRNP